MTRGSIEEYTVVMRARYLKANRKGKGRVLDEFTEVTGYHRKAAIRLLGRDGEPPPKERRGRPRRYDPNVVGPPLEAVWEASDYLCSRRLHPFMGEWIALLQHHGELTLDTSIEVQLCRMSPSTIDRLLRVLTDLG